MEHLATDAHDLIRHAADLRDTWQGKVLACAQARGNNQLAICSMLAHAFDEAMPVLLRVVKPSCWDAERQSLRTPFLCSIAKIDKRALIVVDVIAHDAAPVTRDVVIYGSLGHFQDEMRRVADAAKLTDEERVQFFICAKNWVAADRRLDPTMDPADPDARRLVN